MALAGGSVTTANGGFVFLVPSLGRLIDLGSATDAAANTLELSDAELDTITTSVLRIGAGGGGTHIILSAPVAPANVVTLSLNTVGAIIDGTATEQADITVTNLALRAGPGIGATDDLDVAVTNLALSNTAGTIHVTNSGALTLGTVDEAVGSTNAGTTTITAGSPLTVAADVTDTGTILLTASDSAATGDDLTVAAGITIESTAGSVTLQAGDNLNLVAGSTVQAAGIIVALIDFGNLDAGVGGTADVNGTITATSMGVDGNNDSDTFNIRPSATTPIFIDGKDPTPPASPGDVLNVDLAGTTDANLIAMSTATGFQGSWTFTNRQPVHFTEIESLSETTISISADVSAAEGNTGTTPFVFSVTLGAAAQSEVTVVVSTQDNTAISGGVSANGGNDYEVFSTTLTFAPGQTSKQVTVLVNGDATFEANETFFVNLSAAVNASVVDARAQATIANDDQQPTLSINDRAVPENVGNAVFTVTLSSPSAQIVTVAFTTADNSAMAGNDYQSTSGSLTFMPGETIKSVTVAVVNDSLDEPNERFVVNLLGAMSAGASDPQGVGTILANDSSLFAVGADAGRGPHVRVFIGASATERFGFYAFNPAFTGGVRVAMGDVSGDGTPDIIVGAGPGGGPHVRVIDGTTGDQVPFPIGGFYAYDVDFKGGVFVASADFNNDGFADILTGAGEGGGAHIKVFNGVDGTLLASFMDSAKGSAGVRVATGDINGDGTPDIITGSGPSVFPVAVRVFNGLTTAQIAGPLGSFIPYPGTFSGGVHVAAGDVNGDGRDDIITGAGAGGGPHVKAFSGLTARRSPASSPMALPSPAACASAWATSIKTVCSISSPVRVPARRRMSRLSAALEAWNS